MDDLKRLIRSILISSPLEMQIWKLNKDYDEINGEDIPYRTLGYASLEDLLRSIPDVVQVHGNGPKAVLKVVVGAKSAHIDKLISKQRVSQPRKRTRNRLPPPRRRPAAPRHYGTPQPAPFPCQQFPYRAYPFPHPPPQYSMHPLRPNTPAFHFQSLNSVHVRRGFLPPPAGYDERRYNTPPRLNHTSTPNKPSPTTTFTPFKSPQSSPPLPKTPDLSVLKNQPTTSLERSSSGAPNNLETNTPSAPSKSPVLNGQSRNGAIPKEKTNVSPHSSPQQSPKVDCYYSDQDWFLSDEELTEECLTFPEEEYVNYNVPFAVQENLKQLIGQCKEGIWCCEMPDRYMKMFRKPLDYSEYGYRSLIQMCMGLENIFYCHRPDNGDFFLFDKSKPVPRDILMSLQCVSSYNTKLESKCRTSEAATGPAVIDVQDLIKSTIVDNYPAGVMQHGDEIPRQFVSDQTAESDFIDVVVGEVYDPSKFWILLKEQSSNLDMLMDEMQTFYTSFDGNLEIPDYMIRAGLYCAAKYNNEYHRAIIVNTAVSDSKIKVFYADYGTLSTINRKGLSFLHKKFSHLPLQAIRARLASIWPPVASSMWSPEASNLFLNLVRLKDLVAQLFRIIRDKRTLEIFLVDTTTNEDIYMNDTLVKEGLALFTNKEQAPKPLNPRRIPKYKHMHLFPTFEDLENGNALNAVEVYRLARVGIQEEYLFPTYFIEGISSDDIKPDQDEFMESQKKLLRTQKRLLKTADRLETTPDWTELFREAEGEVSNNHKDSTSSEPRPDWAELCKKEEDEVSNDHKDSTSSEPRPDWAELCKKEEEESLNDQATNELTISSLSEEASPSPEAAISPARQIFTSSAMKPPPGFERVRPEFYIDSSNRESKSESTADHLRALAKRASATTQAHAQPIVLPQPILMTTQPVNFVTQQVIDPTLFMQNDLLRQMAFSRMLGYDQQTRVPGNAWNQEQVRNMLINQQNSLLIAQQQNLNPLLFQQQNPVFIPQQQNWSNPNQMFQQGSQPPPASNCLGAEQRQQFQEIVHRHLMNGNRHLLFYLGNMLKSRSGKKEGLLFKILYEVQLNQSTAISLPEQEMLINDLLNMLADCQIIDLAKCLLSSMERGGNDVAPPNVSSSDSASDTLVNLMSQVSVSSKPSSESSRNLSKYCKSNSDAEVQTDVELEDKLKPNTRRLVVQAVLEDKAVHVIRFKDSLYVPVNDIFQFTTNKQPIDVIRKLVLMIDPASSMVDIRLSEHKELAEELSQYNILDSTLHAVSIVTVPSVTKFLGANRNLFDSYNDFMNSVNVNSALWLKS